MNVMSHVVKHNMMTSRTMGGDLGGPSTDGAQHVALTSPSSYVTLDLQVACIMDYESL